MFRFIILMTAALACFTSFQEAAAQQKDKTAIHTSAPTHLSEDQKIDLLLNHIRNLKGATCTRNGSQHTPTAAADHLQSKREKHASEIKSAEDFIQHLATKSSSSGEYYTVKLSDGREVKLGDVLMQELKKIEGQ
jgi:hypothetical protein